MLPGKFLRLAVLTIFIAMVATNMAGASATEWLSLCGQCLNPSITSKSAIGTANAVADARITRQDVQNWCSNWHPEDKSCVSGQMASDDVKKSYRATANCTAGTITAIDRMTYKQAGVWASDVGKGRARFRNSTGAIVGQDEGSGGLAIAEQWEILCPGGGGAATTAAPSPVPSNASRTQLVGAQFAAGDVVEAKYSGSWIRGKIRTVRQTSGHDGPELIYEVMLDNGQRGMLPANFVRAVSSGGVAAATPEQPASHQPISSPAAASQSSRASSVCGGQPNCNELPTFAATLTDFRTSVSGRFRVASATIRFQNKTDKTLILGYVSGSGVTTDDQGNRYSINSATGVRAMGVITNQVDTKFSLQPGETSDARFEFGWVPGHSVIGTSYDMDLTVREINPVSGKQYELGAERLIHFSRLGDGPLPGAGAMAGDGAMPHPGGANPPSGTMHPAPAPEANPCGATPHCYNAGAFTAEVQQLIASAPPRQNRVVRMNVKFRNVSSQPIILGYLSKTSSIIDNQGNQYYSAAGGAVDVSVSGMGMVAAGKADTSFTLNPGESRNASFQLFRKTDHSVIGSSFSWTVSIAQLQILANGQQVNTLREYSLTFPDMSGAHF